MKTRKKMLAGIITSIMVVAMYSGSAFAAATCDNTAIVGVGTYPGSATADMTKYRVKLRCDDTTPAWAGDKSYYLSTDQGDSGYATILTAFSLGKSIYVYLGSAAANSIIFNVYVNP